MPTLRWCRICVGAFVIAVLMTTAIWVRNRVNHGGLRQSEHENSVTNSALSGSKKKTSPPGIADLHSWKSEDYFSDRDMIYACGFISRHDLSGLEAKIDSGLDVNKEGVYRFTLLHWAFACANLEAFQLLLASGADPDVPLKRGVKSRDLIVFYTGDSILHTAARQDWFHPYLLAGLKYCRNPESPGARGHTLFKLVTDTGGADAEALRELLKLGANPNVLDGGQSGYIKALIMKDSEVIRVLFDFNADPCAGLKKDDFHLVERIDEWLKEARQKNLSDEVAILEEFKAAVMKCGPTSN